MYVTKKTWGASVAALAALALLTGAADTSALTAPAADPLPGALDFTEDGPFVVPEDVTALTVYLWGAGGGGATGGSLGQSGGRWGGGGGGGAGGGGGGGGYYVACRLTGVRPGTQFEVHVGRGGNTVDGPDENDQVPTAGGDSWVTVGGDTIVLAKGGLPAVAAAKGGNAVGRRHGV
ncbi:MAG: hypothetical protein HOY76_41145, partial [Streptomyces sp.]|nr:hypothetical protein [Streptomyces sp.]